MFCKYIKALKLKTSIMIDIKSYEEKERASNILLLVFI